MTIRYRSTDGWTLDGAREMLERHSVNSPERAPPTYSEIIRQTWADTTRVQNQDASATNRIDAYDAANDRIKAATGVSDLINPARDGAVPRLPGQPVMPGVPYPAQIDGVGTTPIEQWKARIAELRQQHPDALDWDDIVERPERDAWAKMKEVREATERLDQRMGAVRGDDIPYLRNVPLVREVAAVGANLARAPVSTMLQFGTGFAAAMTSPIDAAANVLGFSAGTRAMSLLRTATNNALANAAVQAPLSAAKMADYQQAGLPFGWNVWLSEVEGAASAGFVLDAAFRSPVRAVRAYRGETGLGGVLLDAVPEAKMPPKPEGMAPIAPETIAASERGDLAATRQILEATGAIDDPEVRGALNQMETVGRLDAAALKRLEELGVPKAEGMRILDGLVNGRYVRPADVAADVDRMTTPLPARIPDADAARVVDTARASLDALAPGLADMVSMAVEARAQSIEAPVRRALEALEGAKPDPARIAETLAREVRDVLDDPAEAERIGRMIRVASGSASSPEIARMIQADPGLKSSLNVDLARHAEALALSTMSDADLSRVLSGEVPPQVGAWIANHIPVAKHGEALDVIAKARPADMAEAVRLLDETVDQSNVARETSLARTDGMSEPTGAELQRRVELMRQDAGEAVKAAQEPIKERDKLDSKVEGLKGDIAKIEEKAAQRTARDEIQAQIADKKRRIADNEAWLAKQQKPYNDLLALRKDRKKLERRFRDSEAYRRALEKAEDRAYTQYPAHLENDRLRAELEQLEALLTRDGQDPARADSPNLLYSITDDDASTLAKKRAELHEAETQLADANLRLNPDPVSARELHAFAMRSIAIRREQDVRRAVAHAVMLGRAIAPEGTRIDVRTEEMRSDTGQLVEAYYAKGDGAIVLASYAADPTARMGHEVVHALVDVDALSPAEVKLLADEAVSSGVFTPDMRQRYADAYKDRANVELLLQEEAAAHLIDARLSGKAKGAENTVAGRLAQLIERLRNLIKGYGFRSREDVVAAVLNGEAARRAQQAEPIQRWMADNDVSAMAVRPGAMPEQMFAFAGERARTADLEALARAKEMEAAGTDRTAIWSQTGWFRGVDGKWRFEIDDSQAKWVGPAYAEMGDRMQVQAPAGNLLSFPDLRAAYPSTAATPVQYFRYDNRPMPFGGYNPETGGIRVRAVDESLQTQRSTILHEGQHELQTIEGFAQGGNLEQNAAALGSPEAWKARMPYVIRQMMDERGLTTTAQRIDAWPEIKAELRQRIVDDTGRPAWFGSRVDGMDNADRAAELARSQSVDELQTMAMEALRQTGEATYNRLAGEVEARAVQKRLDMTADERRARPPWLDYDVPEDQQIVRLADGSGVSQLSYSAPPPVDGFPTMASDVMFAIRAYHGSPHDFDRFDMSKIGTGEGAQAYGHGLYFAESEAVAKSYRDAFTNLHDARSTKAKELIDEFSGDVNAAIAEAERSLRYFSAMKDKRSQRDAQGWRLVLDELKSPRNEPRLYEVRINADPEDFIDWDKPLSQQSEKARAVLEPKLADDYFAPDAPIGQILQRELLQRDAVQPLREAGIPGIRYLDQGSRGAGEGSRNYVVFDDSLIEIVAKDGKPVEAAERKAVVEGMTAKPESDGPMFSMAGQESVTPGLDMSPEARKARAEAMGFDTSRTWYHVTDVDFEAFSLRPKKRNTDAEAIDVARAGIWFSDAPERVATRTGMDSDGGRTIPVYARGDLYNAGTLSEVFTMVKRRGWKNDLINRGYAGIIIKDEEFSVKGNAETNRQVADLARRYNELNRQAEPFYRQGAPLPDDMRFEMAAIYAELKPLQAKQRREWAEGQTTSIAVFDPRNIRSVNAAFDPARADSPNLMFAMADDAPAPRPILETEYGAIDRMNQIKHLIEACAA